MGVRAGGCSGMSYIMDMMKPEEEVDEGDTEVTFDGVRCAPRDQCWPSLRRG